SSTLPPQLKQLVFFNENNSTILNVCIPLADNTKISPEGKNYFHYSDIKTVKFLVVITKR
ncbi:hypothetical protein, partial [Elizabethkingia anophelis]|uniref:hypothetical protein n=1 Tax=Elizabethkingia anophelis TaxID=1117645 RepID=UPI00372E53DD